MLYKNKLDSYFIVNEKTSLQYPLHIHRYIEIVHVIEGKLDMQIGPVRHILNQGDIAFIFPNIAHDYHTLSDDAHTSLNIVNCSLELLPLYKMKLEGYYPHIPVIRNDNIPDDLNWIENRLNHIPRALLTGELVGSLISAGFCFAFPYLRPMPVDQSVNKELSTRIISYIGDHALENLSLDSLSRQFGIGRYALSRIFSNILGTNLAGYINSQRINYAKFQLLNTEKDISTVCYECGYHNQQTFNRIFKKVTGINPTTYRKLHSGLLYPSNLTALLPGQGQITSQDSSTG